MELHENYKFYTRIDYSIISFDLKINENDEMTIKDFENIKGPYIVDMQALQKINEVVNAFCLDEIEYKFIELPTWLR